jgi:GcrA cell cycle regulator
MTTWTEERTNLMYKLFADGKRASQVAEELGVTRNAVIGKMHRSGHRISAPDNTEKPLRVRRRLNMYHLEEVQKRPVLRFKPVRVAPKVIKLRLPKRPTGSCTILELDSTRCRWPMWNDDIDPRLYCGNETVNRVYCKEHRERAKQKFNNVHEYVRRDPSRDFVIKTRPAKSPKSMV